MKIYEANLAHWWTKILPRTIDPHFRNIAESPLNLYTIFHFAKPRSRYNLKRSNHLKRFISWSKKSMEMDEEIKRVQISSVLFSRAYVRPTNIRRKCDSWSQLSSKHLSLKTTVPEFIRLRIIS